MAFSGCSKEIHWPWSAKSRKARREHPRVEKAARGPRLAIIIDDLGNDPAEAKAVLALPFPLTASVLPHLDYSTQTADEAWRRGDQVILHLPMQPVANVVKPEAIELRPGMSASQVQSALAGMLATVPHAIGVNNHEGSRATADPRLMAELMPALRTRRLFFIDSRTTAATVAYDAAERGGVRAASRKVFLDDTPTREAVLAQLEIAARDAARDGSAIAIGHPHPETIAALSEGVPKLEAHGIHVVFASDLVR
ncbi:MAG: divergent polysaccharide deacetylase family protein [Terracidiphilus sp.]